jgi:hypothetical protein
MPRREKSKYTNQQRRTVEQTELTYKRKGAHDRRAKDRAVAAVNDRKPPRRAKPIPSLRTKAETDRREGRGHSGRSRSSGSRIAR